MSTLEGNAIGTEGLIGRFDARFRRPLMSYFLRRVNGDHAEAEDLTQQVFVRLLRTSEDLDKLGHADGYVFTIAANLLKDRRGSARMRYELPLPSFDEGLVAELTEELLEERSPERVLLARETLAGAMKALDSLSSATTRIREFGSTANARRR